MVCFRTAGIRGRNWRVSKWDFSFPVAVIWPWMTICAMLLFTYAFMRKRNGVSCPLPHTSLISSVGMFNEGKSACFSRSSICPVTFALFPQENLSIIITTWWDLSQAGACKRLWSRSHVGKVRHCGLFVFTLPPFSSRWPNMNWSSGKFFSCQNK